MNQYISAITLRLLEFLPNSLKGCPRFKNYIVNQFSIKGYSWSKLNNRLKVKINIENLTERHLWLGLYPKNIESFLKKNLGANSSFIDAGANIGIWSLLALDSALDQNIHVFSFEPNQVLHKRLLDSKSKNKLNDFWSIFNYGLSDLNTTKKMYINPFCHQMSTLENLEDDRQHDIIEVKKLDSLVFKNLEGIKIDVEGHETKVIRGALKTIQKHLPWIVVEFNSLYTKTTSVEDWTVKRDLEKLNYKIADISLGDDDPSCRDIVFYNEKSKNFNFNL